MEHGGPAHRTGRLRRDVDAMMRSNSGGSAENPEVYDAREITVAEYLGDGTGARVVDVREPEEWVGGHIPGSLLMPMGEVAYRLQELNPDQTVITVCHSGQRSLYSANELLAAGFSDVKSLAGGMIAWVAAGQPVEF